MGPALSLPNQGHQPVQTSPVPSPLPQWERQCVWSTSVCGGQGQASPSVLSLSCLHCETLLLACSSKAEAPSFAQGHSDE